MKKNNRTPSTILMTLALLLISACGFGPYYDNAEIKQDIGGTLICNSVYNADLHSWVYDVSYKYKTSKDIIIDIGEGTYRGRDWNKDEQLVQYKTWTLLKTGDWVGNDKLIIGDIKTNKWFEYKFTPNGIEKDSIWQSLKIHSLSSFCCSEILIDKITNGVIELHYKFRTSQNSVNDYGERRIYYKIDDLTGRPILKKIE